MPIFSITAREPVIWQTTVATRAENGVYKDDANLQGLWLLEEASGTRYDETDNDNDLTDNNTVGQSADSQEGDYSADFEASNSEYLNIADGDQTGLGITGNLSLGCWIKLESLSASSSTLSKYNATGDERGYQLYVETTGAVWFVLSDNGTDFTSCYTANSVISTGTWYHITAVYNGTDMRIYVDGSLSSNGSDNPKTYSSGIYDNTADFDIGHRDGSATYLDGLVDEAFILDRELSADEVSDVYDSGIRNVPSSETSRLYPAYSETLETEKEQYVITESIGFDQAKFTLMGPPDYLMDWFENGLVRDIVWRTPDGGIAWEGYINRMVLSIGDRALTKSVEAMANNIVLEYTSIDTSTNPPTAGPKKTITKDDTISQARYGVKSALISGSECTDAGADDLALAHLELMKYIATTEVVTVGTGKQPQLQVECKGYAHMANWYRYTQTTSSSTANADVVIQAIIADDPNSVLSTSTVNIDSNATATEQYWDGGQLAWKVIQEIAARGYETGNIGYRWTCGVYEGRRVTFKAAEGLDSDDNPYSSNIKLALHRQIYDASDAFIDEGGREWMIWEIRPDMLLFTEGIPGRPMYITKVKFTVPDKLILEGTDQVNPMALILRGTCS